MCPVVTAIVAAALSLDVTTIKIICGKSDLQHNKSKGKIVPVLN
jgi:hypothetical protein